MWVKESLTLTPAVLAGIGVWLTLPWTVKMVFGELVDSVPIFGSQRRAYILIGAAFTVGGLVVLAGAAGQWITILPHNELYVLGALLIVLGTVIQDVVADAMSTEVVPRVDEYGKERPERDVRADLGMVQVLGRLALAFGIFAVAGVSGWLASWVSYSTVFLCGLIVPVVSISGALLVHLETSERRPTDWRILGGGLLFGAFVVPMALSGVNYSQEIIFAVSMGVVIWMLDRVTQEVDHATRMRIVYAAIIIFAFRATPSVGEGYRWFTIDTLGFDEAFYGTLQQLGAVIALVVAWLLSDLITRRPVPQVLLWLTLVGTALALPTLFLVFQLHHVTERLFGIGARSIALFDAAAASPLDQLGMIPLLTLIAIYAPASHRATWFALMASLMNLALTAGALGTKYLNLIFHVDRGSYGHLPSLVIAAYVVSFVLPLTAIAVFGRRVQ